MKENRWIFNGKEFHIRVYHTLATLPGDVWHLSSKCTSVEVIGGDLMTFYHSQAQSRGGTSPTCPSHKAHKNRKHVGTTKGELRNSGGCCFSCHHHLVRTSCSTHFWPNTSADYSPSPLTMPLAPEDMLF